MANTDERLRALETRLDMLLHLVRTGGKESRITENVPAWRASDADGECDYTGVAVPKNKLVSHSNLRVHPGVAAFADERKITDLTQDEPNVPDDYLVTPFVIEFREVYRPPVNVVWDASQIDRFTRPAMLYLCGQLHVAQTLKERGAGPETRDFRGQKNGWLRDCLRAIAGNKEVPDLAPPGAVTEKKPKVPDEVQTEVEVVTPKKPKTGKVTKAQPSSKKKTASKTKTKAKIKSGPRKPSTKKKSAKKAKLDPKKATTKKKADVEPLGPKRVAKKKKQAKKKTAKKHSNAPRRRPAIKKEDK